MKKENKQKREYGEDATKYGECVSSYFGWISPEQQKGRTEELQNMTKDNEKKSKSEKREEK